TFLSWNESLTYSLQSSAGDAQDLIVVDGLSIVGAQGVDSAQSADPRQDGVQAVVDAVEALPVVALEGVAPVLEAELAAEQNADSAAQEVGHSRVADDLDQVGVEGLPVSGVHDGGEAVDQSAAVDIGHFV